MEIIGTEVTTILSFVQSDHPKSSLYLDTHFEVDNAERLTTTFRGKMFQLFKFYRHQHVIVHKYSVFVS